MYSLQEVGIDDIVSVGKLIVAARDGFAKGYADNGGTNKDSLRTYSYSSAARAASNLICVFPVLASRTVSANTAQMVSKFIEQKGCIILQMALQAANISNAKNGMDYLRNFHRNLNVGGDGVDALTKTLNAWIDGMDDSRVEQERNSDHDKLHGYGESSKLSSFARGLIREQESKREVDDSAVYESDESVKISPVQMNALLKEFADAEKYVIYDTKLNPVSINDYFVNENADGSYFVDIKDYSALKEANGQTSTKSPKEEAEDREWELEKRRNQREKWENDKKDRARTEKDYESKARNTAITPMKDQDIKKMNNAVPSLLIVRFYSDSKATVATEFIIGVKSKVVGCNSDEILRRIANDNKDGRFMTNLLRTVSGEMKKSDFLFGISRTEEDLMSIHKKGSQGDTWALLQSRALAAKQAVKQGRINDFSAITTVLISQSDVDDLYKEENIDISNPSVARHFMQSYNLLGFVIADDATESLKMIFDDGDNYFEELSYMMLERETDNGTYKKLINLIASSR